MTKTVIACAALLLNSFAFAKKDRTVPQPPPDSFVIGRHTFFDFGPPFHFYELFIIRQTATGSSIQRLTLSPPGHVCTQPAKLETASANVSDSVEKLLGGTNPCSIPEKELNRELKHCKHCQVFSGSNVEMAVQCGGQRRIIQSNILDKDLFDPEPNTPEHTSWTMQLLARLDQAVGPGVIDRPIYPQGQPEKPITGDPDPAVLEKLSSGNYDDLFLQAPERPSGLYRTIQTQSSTEPVQLESTDPLYPDTYVLPEYPAAAKAAHLTGSIEIEMDVSRNGDVTALRFGGGYTLFREAIKKVATGWKFPQTTKAWIFNGQIDFGLCEQTSQ